MLNARPRAFVFSAPLLALAMAFGPAYADSTVLSCDIANGGAAFTYRVDYATGRFEQLGPDGNAYTDRIVTATVSPNTITWSVDQPASYLTLDNVRHQTTEHWEGYIDRLAATGWQWSYYVDRSHVDRISFTCSKAEAKF